MEKERSYGQFGACLKSGVSSAKLVELELTLARPASSNGHVPNRRFHRAGLFPIAGLNGRCAIRKGQPASQQRVSPSGLKTFPPAGKSGLSPGKREWNERLWCVTRRASQSSSQSYPIDIGYGALTEQARMTGRPPIHNCPVEGSVAGITEQVITVQVQYMDIEYVLGPRTNGANAFSIFEYLPKINTEVLANRLKRLTYEQFLQTAYWFAVSHVAKSRAYMRCQVCNQGKGLNVHHRTYDTHGYEHLNMHDLVVLDENCHGLFHGHLEPVPKNLNKVREPRAGRVVPHDESALVMPDGDPIVLTKALIDRCRANGSFTTATMRGFGLTWPLGKGWTSRLIGKSLSRDKFKEALEGKFIYSARPLERRV